jgi:hypothetical protein
MTNMAGFSRRWAKPDAIFFCCSWDVSLKRGHREIGFYRKACENEDEVGENEKDPPAAVKTWQFTSLE